MALTVSNRREEVMGRFRAIFAQLVSTTGTDVWTTGLRTIRGANFEVVAGSQGNVGASAISSAGAVTLAVPANSTVLAIVYGW